MDKQVVQYYRALTPDILKKFWEAGGVINGQQYPLADSFLHTHTDMGSPKDSVLTIDEYLKVASDMGTRAISITDHGTMYGVIPLYKACDDYNVDKPDDEQIKCIIGVEFYVCENVESNIKRKQTRLHLIAYAKDDIGYKILCRLTTEGNKHIITVGANNYPCISRSDLEHFIGPGTDGHGHVILTSACIGGVIAGIMYESDNEKINLTKNEHAIQALQTLIDSYNFQQDKLSKLQEQKATVSQISKKTYKKRQNELNKHPDPALQAQLDKEIAETQTAIQNLPKITSMVNATSKAITEIKKNIESQCKAPECIECDNILDKAKLMIQILEKANEDIKPSIIDAEHLEEAFETNMRYYQELAGEGNWFIEMQYHGIPQEQKYMHILASLAHKLNIPLVAANDAHMATKEMTTARAIVNALRFDATWEEPAEDAYELYLKTDAELYQWLCKAISSDDAMEAMINRKLIVDACNVKIVKQKHYPKFVA